MYHSLYHKQLKRTCQHVGFMSLWLLPEGLLLAITESLTAPSFDPHINQWSFLSFVLQSRKPTSFQKVAQLERAGGNAPARWFQVCEETNPMG